MAGRRRSIFGNDPEYSESSVSQKKPRVNYNTVLSSLHPLPDFSGKLREVNFAGLVHRPSLAGLRDYLYLNGPNIHPSITFPTSHVTAILGDDLTLVCLVKGRPTPVLQWALPSGTNPADLHNSSPYNDRYRFEEASGNVTIFGVVQTDAGIYICRATNLVGTATESVDVIVRGAAPSAAKVTDRTSTALALTWEPPPPEHSGLLLSYQVEFGVLRSSDKEVRDHLHLQNRQIVISQLKQATAYEFFIRGVYVGRVKGLDFIVNGTTLKGTTLSVNDLGMVLEKLNPARTWWYNMGLKLKLEVDTLDTIKARCSGDPSECFREMLKEYLKKTTPLPSWRSLAEALRSPIVNEPQLAENVERACCVHTHPTDAQATEAHQEHLAPEISTPSVSETVLDEELQSLAMQISTIDSDEDQQQTDFGFWKCSFDSFLEKGCPKPIPSMSSFPYLKTEGLNVNQKQILIDRLCREHKLIKRDFASLFYRTCESLIQQGVPVKKLVRVLMALDCFESPLPEKPLLEERREEINAADSIDDVFVILKDYLSFFGFDILEFIIHELGTPEDKERLKNYETELNEYSRRNVFECPPELSSIRKDQATLAFKVDGSDVNKYTENHIKMLTSRISNIFKVSQYTLRLCTVEKGCIQLTFQIPHFVKEVIFPLSESQKTALQAEGVIRLTCGDYQCSFQETVMPEVPEVPEEHSFSEDYSCLVPNISQLQPKLEPLPEENGHFLVSNSGRSRDEQSQDSSAACGCPPANYKEPTSSSMNTGLTPVLSSPVAPPFQEEQLQLTSAQPLTDDVVLRVPTCICSFGDAHVATLNTQISSEMSPPEEPEVPEEQPVPDITHQEPMSPKEDTMPEEAGSSGLSTDARGSDMDNDYSILQSVQEGTSRKSLAHVRYLYGAVLPASKVQDDSSIPDLYYLLKEQQEHHDTALSLTVSILQHAGSPDKVRQLEQIVENQYYFDTEKHLPQLALRKLLAAIANELEEAQCDTLVNYLAHLELKENPDSFVRLHSFESLLAVFVRMELQQLLVPGDPKLLCLHVYLKEMGRKDVVANHLDSYDPHCPFSLAVIESEGQSHLATHSTVVRKKPEQVTLTSYQSTLREVYNVMPKIPHNQWPPVKKAHYVSLALITSEEMVRTDLYSRNTVQGSVDDIITHKKTIDFKHVFPEETIKNSSLQSILIEGRPGCGKTTLMIKVTKDWAEQKILKDVTLFILVTLKRFMGKKDITLADILGVYCPSSCMTKELVNEIYSTGGKGVVFAFDGLDEYSPASEKGNLICNIIRGTKLPNARVFITSRPAGSHRFRRLVQANIEIIGFLKVQVHQYIRDHYEETPGKASSLIVFLNSHPNIGRMCYLPLHLAMLVYLYEYQTKLPETETEMYKTFVLHTLFRAIEREDPDEADDLELHEFCMLPERKHPIFANICRLAFEATCTQKKIFTGKEILHDKVLPIPPSGKDFDSLGLLTVDRQIAERSLPTRTYSFPHLTLQEFLSAVYIFELKSDKEQLDIIQNHGGEVHMRVVWKFYCGLSCEQKIFLNSFKAIIEQNISNRLGVLHMMHCAYESTKVNACHALLQILHGRIDVMDVTLNQFDCTVLGYVVTKAFKLLTQIDLRYCHIGPEGIAAFVEHIQELPEPLNNVDTLRLHARIDLRPIGPKGAPALLTLLKRLPNLRELRLYGNQLQMDKFKILVSVIASMQNLQTLILSRNSLDEKAGALVSEILEQMPLLHTLYISDNPIGSRGLVALMPGLQKCRKLKILGLQGTSLTEDAGKPLAELLRMLPCLERLILYQNKLRDRGVKDMLLDFWDASALIELSLVENEISDAGAIALAQYLANTKSLTEIRLYYNNLSDTGKIAVRSAVLGRPASLVELNLAL